MYESVLQGALELPLAQKKSLIECLKGAVLAQMSSVHAGDPSECPRCHHGHVVRKGRDGKGRQRWLCRGCGRTFGTSTLGLLAQSKLGPAVWASYVEHMVEGESLQRCADLCGVCLKTSWFMRMRVCEVMRNVLAPFRGGAGLSVQIDEKYLSESFCGNRDRARVKMPRQAHANGNSVHKRGLSKLKACVVTLVNDLGDCACEVVGRGKPTKGEVKAGIEGCDLEGSTVTTDSLASYASPLRDAGVAAHSRYNASVGDGDGVGMVNALHERMSSFLSRFNGVSTRRLQRYMWWFCWSEQVRRSDSSSVEALRAHVANGTYRVTRRMLTDEPQPFWEYWEGRMPEVTEDDLWGPEAMSILV